MKPSNNNKISQLGPDWDFSGSSSVPLHPTTLPSGTGWSFPFPRFDGPQACWEVNCTTWIGYLTTPYNGTLPLDKSLSMTTEITSPGLPMFKYDTEQGNTCPTPAHVRFLVQAGKGKFANGEFGRWWSNPVATTLDTLGPVTIIAPINPSQWTSVFGKRGDLDATTLTAFKAVMANPGKVGMTFGGGCFFGHGVYVSGADAMFKLIEYSLL